jgi:small subunit ribosomal protein S6
MTRAYEIAVVIDPQMTDPEVERFLHTLRQLFAKQDVVINEEDIWGRRPTAYLLQGHQEGFYAFFKVAMPTDKVAAMEQALKLNESIVRHLIILEEK